VKIPAASTTASVFMAAFVMAVPAGERPVNRAAPESDVSAARRKQRSTLRSRAFARAMPHCFVYSERTS